MASTPLPDIPTNNVKLAIDQIRELIARIRKEGGFVTTKQMVDSGLFTADLAPYLTAQAVADDRIPPPQSIDVAQQLYASSATSAGVFRSRMLVDWNTAGPRAQYYELELWKDGILFQAAQTPALEHIFSELDPAAYEVRIRTVGAYLLRSQAISAFLTITGKTDAPNGATGLSLFTEDRWLRFAWVQPSATVDPDLAGFKIKVGRSVWGVDDETANGIDVFTVGLVESMLWAPNKTGTVTFMIKAFDLSGNYSGMNSATRIIVGPAFPGGALLTSQVIDNNVLLSWTAAIGGDYPIDRYEVRKGIDYASAAVVGEKSGTFTTIFETVAGTYKYWITAIDSAGLYTGNPVSTYASVSQPPDFILNSNLYLSPAWAGTKDSCFTEVDGSLTCLVNLTETFGEHFTNNSWDQPDDQIAAGFPVYAQPGTTPAYYEEVIDYASVLSSSKVVMDVTRTTPAGTVTITPTISVKLNIGDAWTDYVGVYQAYASGFRYVKYRLDFETTDNGILNITQLNVRLEMKQKTYEGNVQCTDTDTGGTSVDITGIFVDVNSIQVTPLSTTALIACYDFVDAANPTTFKILLFDTNGNRASARASYIIRGV